MFIETDVTPNPDTLKFLPGRTLLEQGTANFSDIDAADNSPLAQALFAIDGVSGVFIGYDFVSVTKATEMDWTTVKPLVLAGLMQFFASGAPVITGSGSDDIAVEESEEDADIIEQIKTLLDEKVRPAVAGDGGDIIYRGFKEGVVYLQMQGACAGCPSSTITLKHGIENLLKYYVPEVIDVQPVEM
ncbi:NifU family protein [Kordiimonas sp. SCSIO 12610]|uniref:NifU family protein n=1 Tax=Kordiimonas sp. SCSIO 12610 TaxID=2829597 RepID=UPI00210CBFB3|nr:NifU family protein [Kordiimonas sp. SCSIO 12610]UTW55084.1 NifU family protein [Kordiimonas sp. SCSIO 12610]